MTFIAIDRGSDTVVLAVNDDTILMETDGEKIVVIDTERNPQRVLLPQQ